MSSLSATTERQLRRFTPPHATAADPLERYGLRDPWRWTSIYVCLHHFERWNAELRQRLGGQTTDPSWISHGYSVEESKQVAIALGQALASAVEKEYSGAES